MMEELPSKIERDLKRIEQRDHEMKRTSQSQLQMNSEQITVIKDQLMVQLD